MVISTSSAKCNAYDENINIYKIHTKYLSFGQMLERGVVSKPKNSKTKWDIYLNEKFLTSSRIG